MLWHTPSARFWRNLPAGFIQPCQPTLVANPPAGPGWLHEVKHDGFRILARKQGEDVAVWSRRGKGRSEQAIQLSRDDDIARSSFANSAPPTGRSSTGTEPLTPSSTRTLAASARA